MEIFLKNKTNSNGLLLSSGFYNGVDFNPDSFPYLGYYSELDALITPKILFNTVNNFAYHTGRLIKTTTTSTSD